MWFLVWGLWLVALYCLRCVKRIVCLRLGSLDYVFGGLCSYVGGGSCGGGASILITFAGCLVVCLLFALMFGGWLIG